MFILGILVFVVMICVYILLGAQMNVFLDMSTLLYVIIGYVAILLTTQSFKEFYKGILLANKKDMKVECDELKKMEQVYKVLSKASWGIGLMGIIISVMSMFATLDSPSSVGPAMNNAFMAIFYTLLINTIFLTPIRFFIKKRIIDSK